MDQIWKRKTSWIILITLAAAALAAIVIYGISKPHAERGKGEPASAESSAVSTASPAAPSANTKERTASYELTVDGTKPGAAISPTLYGVFFEEINHAGDGGLYAELISNRSFEDSPDQAARWWVVKNGKANGSINLVDSGLLNKAQGHALALTVTSAAEGEWVGAANNGYWGIPVEKGAAYQLSFYAKRSKEFQGPLAVRLESANGKQVYAEGAVKELTEDWKKYSMTLTSSDTSANARFVIALAHQGTVVLDVVSLFPETWKGRANGLRMDLAEKVDSIDPKFLRFPGGCFVEGNTTENAFQWKNTIGDIADRSGHWGIWNYRSTDGLGFHEYLQWAEDMHAEPLYVVNVGISHDGNPFTQYTTVPLSGLKPWIQDALDAIEYANGPVTSFWGAKRAANGHPEPFNLKYIEVGNENNFQYNEYVKRYPLFYKAIKEKYPELHIIADTIIPGQPIEIVDEHYYESPQWFMDNAARYDTYDRNGPKIYVGEYAVTKGSGRGNLHAALGEAAFMTGMEKNSDIVSMASYAPLFVNDQDRTWNPDAIVFNSSTSFGTPSFYVQQMFGQNTGNVILPAKLKANGEETKPEPVSGAVGVGSWATQVEFDDVLVTGKDGKTLLSDNFTRDTSFWKTSKGSWKTEEGVYKQSSSDTDIRSVAGDASWSDYTLTLKARKTGGSEGMLIMFGVKDSGTYYWLNLGGWGNTQHAIEKSVQGSKSILGKSMPGHIESDRWYDIKIELSGPRIRAYLDGELIQDVTDAANAGPLFYAASKDTKSGDILIKVVNTSKEEQQTDIRLEGIAGLQKEGEAIIMDSENLTDENSFSEPEKVAPKKMTFGGEGGSYPFSFPPYSVSVLRFHSGGNS